MQPINVLSLFDGISCGRVALERAGIPVAQYYASEILSDAIKIAHKNYPDTVDLGDITKISDETMDTLPQIDLLIGGSPCQDLSVYKFDRGECTGLNGEKSGLFYHYLRILKYIKPRFFLLENVPMLKQWEDTISELLGVKPILINSSLVCAADRKRLYWTNIPGVSQPEDRGIVLADIVQNADEVPQKYWYDKPFTYNGDDEKVQCTLQMKGHRHMKEVYNLKGKCATLTTCNGGNLQKKVYQDGRCRKLTPLEYERLQTLPEGYTEGICDTARYSAIGNGWTVDIIAHILGHIGKNEQKPAENVEDLKVIKGETEHKDPETQEKRKEPEKAPDEPLVAFNAVMQLKQLADERKKLAAINPDNNRFTNDVLAIEYALSVLETVCLGNCETP